MFHPMLQFNKYTVLILFVWLLFLSNCKKKEVYPPVPYIEYKTAYFYSNAEGVDTLMVLVFSFKDGDGDLGLGGTDTLAPFNAVIDSLGRNTNPYYYNLQIDYLEQVNGVFQPVTLPFTSDSLRYFYRFENITPEGRHKAIRGDIEIKIQSSPFPDAKDTVMYTFFVYDRALHKSNVASSIPLVWNR
jgi:hypothetical protein